MFCFVIPLICDFKTVDECYNKSKKAKVLQSEYCDWIIGSTKMIKIQKIRIMIAIKFHKIKNMTESIDSFDSTASHSHIEHADRIKKRETRTNHEKR
jgi:hypothetical protein